MSQLGRQIQKTQNNTFRLGPVLLFSLFLLILFLFITCLSREPKVDLKPSTANKLLKIQIILSHLSIKQNKHPTEFDKQDYLVLISSCVFPAFLDFYGSTVEKVTIGYTAFCYQTKEWINSN